MMRYIQTMIRNEPGTFIVMLLMISLLLFGVWINWPKPRAERSADNLPLSVLV